MRKPARPKYTPGQRVNVRAIDFTIPGAPEVWRSGTVTAVGSMRPGGWAVTVTLDGRRPPIRYAVAEHGRSNYIRAL
jgi:hypothetical protein